ncbi:MAG: CPBP family intramembrane glutamic endopeptidase [Candidatus Izemoplasmatales bacterium]
MPNPYEDLFKNARTPAPAASEPALPGSPEPAPVDSSDPLDDLFKTRRTNLMLIVVYVLGLVLVNVAMYGIFMARYPEIESITANIVEIGITSSHVESDLYEGFPYAVTIVGRYENRNSFSLGSIYVDYTFLDREGKILGKSSYSEDEVESGGGLVVVDTLYFETEVASVVREYGFDMSSTFYLVVNAIHGFAIAVAFLLIDRLHLADRWRRFRKSWKSMVGHIVMGEVQVYLVLILSTLAMDWLGISSGSENESAIASMFKPDALVLVALFLTLCVFTPIIEETIFRKVFFGLFPKRFGPVVPIVASGLVFGLMHVVAAGDYLQSIPYVMMGFVFGYVYWISGKNVYVTIGVHFLNNLVSFLIYVAAIYGAF